MGDGTCVRCLGCGSILELRPGYWRTDDQRAKNAHENYARYCDDCESGDFELVEEAAT